MSTTPSRNGPVAAYLRELAERLRQVAGDELVGVYAGGSYALAAFEPGRSDLDVAAVVRSPATPMLKEEIVAAIRHETLAVPARGLEFVLYRLAVAREPTIAAAFELNLNTGAGMSFRADFEPRGIESHWFPVDRSILAEHGVTVVGPPAADVFAPIPRQMLLPVILESMRWHARNTGPGDDAVLNACRSLRFALDGVWSSKPEAGQWALDRVPEPDVVRAALAVRRGAAGLDPAAGAAIVDAAIGVVAGLAEE